MQLMWVQYGDEQAHFHVRLHYNSDINIGHTVSYTLGDGCTCHTRISES